MTKENGSFDKSISIKGKYLQYLEEIQLLVQYQKHCLKVLDENFFLIIILNIITRKKQLLEANWDEYQAEEESRERIKRIQV